MTITPEKIKLLILSQYLKINVKPENHHNIDAQKFAENYIDFSKYYTAMRKELLSKFKNEPLIKLLKDYEKIGLEELATKLDNYRKSSGAEIKYFSMLNCYGNNGEDQYPSNFFDSITNGVSSTVQIDQNLAARYILISEIANVIALLMKKGIIEEGILFFDDNLIEYISPNLANQIMDIFMPNNKEQLIVELKNSQPLYNKILAEFLAGNYDTIINIIKSLTEKSENTVHYRYALEKAVLFSNYEAVKVLLNEVNFFLANSDSMNKEILINAFGARNPSITEQEQMLEGIECSFSLKVLFFIASEAIIRSNTNICLEFFKPEVWNLFSNEHKIELFKFIACRTSEETKKAIIKHFFENNLINSKLLDVFKLEDVSEEFLKFIANNLIEFENDLINALFKELVEDKISKEMEPKKQDAIFISSYIDFLKYIQFFSNEGKTLHINSIINDLIKHSTNLQKYYNRFKEKTESKNLTNLLSLVLEKIQEEENNALKSLAFFEKEKEATVVEEGSKKPGGEDKPEEIFTNLHKIALQNNQEEVLNQPPLDLLHNLTSADNLCVDSVLESSCTSPALCSESPLVEAGFVRSHNFVTASAFVPILLEPGNLFSPAEVIFYLNNEKIPIRTQWFYHKESHELIYSLTISGSRYLIDIKKETLANCAERDIAPSKYFYSLPFASPWAAGQYIKIMGNNDEFVPIIELTFKHDDPIGTILSRLIVYETPIEPHESDHSEENEAQDKQDNDNNNEEYSSVNHQNYANEIIDFSNKNNSLLQTLLSQELEEFIMVLPQKISSANDSLSEMNNKHVEFLKQKQEAEERIENQYKIQISYIDNSDKLESVTLKDGQYFITDFANKNLHEIEA